MEYNEREYRVALALSTLAPVLALRLHMVPRIPLGVTPELRVRNSPEYH